MKILTTCSVLIVTLISSGNLWAVDRLFTTAKERQILDSRRYGREQLQGDETSTQTRSLQLNGVVTVNQQPPNIWLNGEHTQNEGPQLKPISNHKAVELFLPERKLHISLKPGQKLDLLTGRRLEPFNVPQKNNGDDVGQGDTSSDESPELLDDTPGANP